jgi:hypothetical protein
MKRLRLRTWVLFGIPGTLLVVASTVYLVAQREIVIDAAFYERLSVGMTEEEVDAAVSIPSGDYTGADAYVTSRPTCDGELPIFVDYHLRADGAVSAPHPVTGRPLLGKWWRGKDGLVIVFFGDNHRVTERRYYPGYSRSWARYHLDRLVP